MGPPSRGAEPPLATFVHALRDEEHRPARRDDRLAIMDESVARVDDRDAIMDERVARRDDRGAILA